MKKVFLVLAIGISLISCKLSVNKTKHFNARNLTDNECNLPSYEFDLPYIDSLKSVYGNKVNNLSTDGVYIVYLSDGTHVLIVN